MPRDDLHLVQTILDLGKKSFGNWAALKIVEIPDGVEWIIREYDGNEEVCEKHRTWS